MPRLALLLIPARRSAPEAKLYFKTMVYLVLQPMAVGETIRLATEKGWFVWVGSDAIEPDEFKRLCDRGARLTRFSYPLAGAEPSVIDDALETIEEHHPGEIVWVQHVWPEGAR